MKLSELKELLATNPKMQFKLPSEEKIPAHFHITEVGMSTKNFIDCGGTVREEHKIVLQLWYSVDITHRLKADKLLRIISLSEEKLQLTDAEVEVEYQADTIGRYGLTHDRDHFALENLFTDCLAKENCGIPVEKIKVKMGELATKVTGSDCCTPGGDCC